jgi:microcystin-dependent protein
MSLWRWSRTSAANASADPTCPFPEGMSASALNDSSRSAMAAVAKYRDDIAGLLVTAGTATAYTLSSFQGFGSLADMLGQRIAFTPHTSNGAGPITLTVDGITKPLRPAPGVELLPGTLVQGTPYTAFLSPADSVWYLHAFYSSPYNVPFLGGLDHWGTVTPNSAFIFPAGQALSRTVYSRAFTEWGTRFGAGDGSTTFNAPDKTGRVSAMLEAVATRLTSGAGGVDGATLGATGGNQNQNIAQNQLPNVAPTFTGTTTTVTVSSTRGDVAVGVSGSSTGGGQFSFNAPAAFTSVSSNGAFTPVGTVGSINGGVAQAGLINVQPTIVCNYIIRII